MGRWTDRWVYVSDSCRDFADSKSIQWRSHPAGTVLVVESLGHTERTDFGECDYVHSDWNAGLGVMEMERASDGSWIELHD